MRMLKALAQRVEPHRHARQRQERQRHQRNGQPHRGWSVALALPDIGDIAGRVKPNG